MEIFPILALDVGTKRIGLAYMSGLASAADFKKILDRAGNRALDEILSLINKNRVKTLVAGLPFTANMRRTPQCADVESFCRRIQRRSGLDAIYIDEYLSSVEASEKTKGKALKIDDHAAEIILKRFLVEKELLGP